MKKMIAVCLATLLATSLGGCAKNQVITDDIPSPTPTVNEQEKEPLKRSGYVGKYSMVGSEFYYGDDEFQEQIDEINKEFSGYIERKKIREVGGLSFDDIEIKSELLCIEIKENQDVNVCVGQFGAQKAKLEKEEDKTYIKLENAFLTGYGDKILLGEADIEGKHYLTFETGTEKRAYFEILENSSQDSIIEVNEDGTLKIEGIFKIDPVIQEQEVGQDVFVLWGSGFRTYGSNLRINKDKTGSYSVGIANYDDFKLIDEDGKMYLEIINPENEELRGEDGAKYLVEVKDINDKKCIVIHRDNNVDMYWTQLSDDAIVFTIPEKGEYIWG